MNSLKFNIFEYGKPWGYFCILIILNALYSLQAYPFWHLNTRMLNISFGLLTLIFVLTNRTWFCFSNKSILLFFIFLAAYFIKIPSGNINRYILPLLGLAPLYILFFIKNIYQVSLLNKFSKILAIIVAISSLGWILHLLNIPLPYFYDFFGEAHELSGQEFQYMYRNHYIFLENIGVYITISRFSCIFLEPGYFSILMVFMLYIGQFNISKHENLIFLIALLLSISLAGYLMGLGAYIAHLYSTGNRKRIKTLLALFIVIYVALLFFEFYNGGHNSINNGFLERMKWNEETENIAGYNRTNDETDKEFIQVITGPNVLLGKKNTSISIYSVGYKPYIIHHGVVGFALFIISLYAIYKNKKCYNSFILLMIFVVMFARGHHVIFYQGFWLVYVCGCSYMLMKQQNQRHINKN